MLGALAVETRRVAFGPLVTRAGLRRPAGLRALLDTVERIAPGRLIVGLGAGDSLSADENRAMGLPDETPADRLAALEATLRALADAAYPVWVGGRSGPVRARAARLADGWNGWNAPLDEFTSAVAHLAEAGVSAGRGEGAVVPTWGGLVELRPPPSAAASALSLIHI